MPILKRANACIYYEDSGTGEPLLLLHGFSVSSRYWSRTGVAAELAGHYRVIAMDLRGHGRSRVQGEPKGYDADTLADDITALADSLGLDRFHLLGHSAGGMVALRYAWRREERLRSLVLMSTAPATAFGHRDPQLRQQSLQMFAEFYERQTWPKIFSHLRQLPGPLLYWMDQLPERERLWALLLEICRDNKPNVLAAFIRTFFTDPDPHLESLRLIACPTLIVVGEHDKLFLPAGILLARAIPHAQHQVLERVGHMTALEAPELTSATILNFLATCRGY
ncbi:MAG: alpha/beta hydrolase [Candidatus Competibacteraceae bacterium]